MRAAAGFIGFNVLLLALGLGLMYALGLARLRPFALMRAAPAGLLAGAALLGLGGCVVLTAGGTLALPPFVVGGLAVAAVLWAIGLARGRGRRAEPDEPAPARSDRTVTWVVGAALVAYIVAQAVASRHIVAAWDAEHNWTLKALALTTTGLDSEIFTARGAFSAAHLDYPIFHPVLAAFIFRFTGTGRQGFVAAEMWLFTGALALAAPYLCGLRSRAWTAILPLALVAAVPTSFGILRGDADITMAIFVAAGTLCLALWIEDGGAGLAVMAALLLGAGLNSKNEGVAFTIGVIVAAALVLVFAARRRLIGLAGVAVALIAFAAPWHLWVAAHGPFTTDVTPLSTSLDLHYLTSRLSTLDYAARVVLGRLTNQGSYAWILPCFLALGIAAVVAGWRRRVAAFYLAGVTLAVLALLWVYWTSEQPDLAGHILRTSLRTITGPLFVAAAGIAHLLARSPTASADYFGTRGSVSVHPEEQLP
jgi:hypothetical protein